jgi:uncharacterized protein YidB (DUF937 family)
MTAEESTYGGKMGLNDILNKLGGQHGEQGGISAISNLFDEDNLQGIMSKLESSGLGQQVQSWVGKGQNMPVSESEIKNAVDPQKLQQVAQQQGMSSDEVADHVAQALPHVVDQATPNGQVPKQSSIHSMMGILKKK